MTTLQLFPAVQEVIRRQLGLDVEICGSQQVTGGCIHTTRPELTPRLSDGIGSPSAPFDGLRYRGGVPW